MCRSPSATEVPAGRSGATCCRTKRINPSGLSYWVHARCALISKGVGLAAPIPRQGQHLGIGASTGGRDMTNADLETRYRAYLAALNERRLDDLVHYVQDELSYNGETMMRRQYQDLIAADIAAIPDLFFDAQIIVASGDRVACRLVFDCTPRPEFLGFSPGGGG